MVHRTNALWHACLQHKRQQGPSIAQSTAEGCKVPVSPVLCLPSLSPVKGLTTQKMPLGEQVASILAFANGPPVVLRRRLNSELSARKAAMPAGQGSSGPAALASPGSSSAGSCCSPGDEYTDMRLQVRKLRVMRP